MQKKQNYMLFTNSCSKDINNGTASLQMDGIAIERVSICKFLGVIIDDKLNWKPHIAHITGIIARNVGVIKRIRYKINLKTALLLYDTMIVPCLYYCNIAWASSAKSNLSKLHALQKNQSVIFLASKFAHTTDLFYRLNRLNVYDIHLLQLA